MLYSVYTIQCCIRYYITSSKLLNKFLWWKHFVFTIKNCFTTFNFGITPPHSSHCLFDNAAPAARPWKLHSGAVLALTVAADRWNPAGPCQQTQNQPWWLSSVQGPDLATQMVFLERNSIGHQLSGADIKSKCFPSPHPLNQAGKGVL